MRAKPAQGVIKTPARRTPPGAHRRRDVARAGAGAPRYDAAMPSCRTAVLPHCPSCRIAPRRRHAQDATMRRGATSLSCYRATALPCCLAALLPYYATTLPRYHAATLLPYCPTTLLTYYPTTPLPHYPTPLLPYNPTTLLL